MEHECSECRGKFGSLKFDAELLRNWVRRPNSRKVCKDCQTKLKCAACKNMFDEKCWTKKERDNHRNLNRKLVCSNCRDKGHHPDDVDKYKCQRCDLVFGGKKFDQKMINNYRNNWRSKLECNECVQRVAQRVKGLQKEVRSRKVRCKCFCQIHREKCLLSLVYHGQRRWPGCDANVSAADRDFLNGLNPQPEWWRQARGRGA